MGYDYFPVVKMRASCNQVLRFMNLSEVGFFSSLTVFPKSENIMLSILQLFLHFNFDMKDFQNAV